MNINRKFTLFLLIILLSFGFNFPSFAQKNSQPQKGMASWYGSKYHGKATSSGERYNKYSMTAAHRTLPFGTKVKVTNLSNNKSVIVRINDRGPFSGKRIIDVSETAAKKLDFMSAGLGKVVIEVIELPASVSAADLTAAETVMPVEAAEARASTIQTGSYSSLEHVQVLPLKLKTLDKNLPIELTEERIKGKKLHRINAGWFGNKQAAEAFNELLKEIGLQGKARGV